MFDGDTAQFLQERAVRFAAGDIRSDLENSCVLFRHAAYQIVDLAPVADAAGDG